MLHSDPVDEQRDPRTYAIIGAAMEVHRVLGPGFFEIVYQEALSLEFAARQVPAVREAGVKITYKGHPLNCPYKADFICFNEIIVELKALDALADAHRAQVINYLKATGLQLALLFNFGAPRLTYERMVLSRPLRAIQEELSADDADLRG